MGINPSYKHKAVIKFATELQLKKITSTIKFREKLYLQRSEKEGQSIWGAVGEHKVYFVGRQLDSCFPILDKLFMNEDLLDRVSTVLFRKVDLEEKKYGSNCDFFPNNSTFLNHSCYLYP